MQNTSTEFKNEIKKTGRTFYPKVVINGKEYTGLNGFKISSGTNSSDVITFGDSVSSFLECTIQEVPDTEHLENKIAIAYIGLQLSKSIEWIKMGTFTVSEAKRDDKAVKIHADDNMLKCEKGFFTDLKGNQSITTILNEQCKKNGIIFVGGSDSASVNVDGFLGMTIREAIGILASFCGKNAVMNRDGNLKFVWYEDSALKISAESFADPLNINETDTLINRIRCTIDKDKEVNVGTGMGIEFSNPLMTEAQLQAIAKRVIGLKYRACDLNFNVGRPDIDAGDIVTVVDKRGNSYVVPIMDITYECDGGVWNKIKSKGKTETAKAYESKGPMTQMIERTYSDLTVTKKLIADTIDAFEGNFETINTNYIRVSGKITAVEGGFELLQADNAIFKTTVTDKLSAYDADIVNLKASYGKINILDADLVRINTLLSGSITSGSTQTIVLNAENTTIANALIKSAMIDSLAAGKITAGIIDASSIHFKSKSGNMDIYDNTISIRDANRVRVQIGKDASSDYNIYVWDNVGKLMFDATGLKADGIKDKIIRDDMVSENANINGSKLNIPSLVTEINNGTSNIKSSHITYDPTGQSLDVAFNSLTSKIDDMEIGGRNLLLKSGNKITNSSYNIASYKLGSIKPKEGDLCIVTMKGSLGTGKSHFGFYNSGGNGVLVSIRAEDFGNGIASKSFMWKIIFGSITTANTELTVFSMLSTVTAPSTIEWIRLDFGNKAPLIWTPAPEDIEDKVTSLSTSLSVEQGRIEALISSNSTIKGDLTKVQSDYTSIKATVSGLSTTVGQHTSSIQTVRDNLDSLEIGGRNLLLKSGQPITTSAYPTIRYSLGDLKPKEGDICTITLKGSLGTGKTYFGIYNTDGYVKMTGIYPEDFKDGVATKIFKWTLFHSQHPALNTHLTIFPMFSTVTVDSTIEWVRLDFGNKAPLIWTPAPEDIDTSIKTVSDKQTAFDVSIAGITERVTKTETNITTINGNVTALTTRVSTAETKVTDSAIVSTVTKSSNWSAMQGAVTGLSNDVSSMKLDLSGFKTSVSSIYATKSSVSSLSSSLTQRVDSFVMEIKESYSRVNLIENSDFTHNADRWVISGNEICKRATDWGNSTGRCLYLNSSTFAKTYNWSQIIKFGRSVKGLYMSAEFLTNSDFVAGTTNTSAAYIVNLYYTDGTSTSGSVKDTSHSWVRVGKYIEVDSSKTVDYVRVYLYGRDFKGIIAFNRPFLCETGVAIDKNYWAPAQSEVSGNTSVVINSDGLNVLNGDIAIYNKSNKKVMYIDTVGNLQCSNAKITGDIIGGTITGNTTINVGTDLFVGNNVYLGRGDDISYKNISLGKSSVGFYVRDDANCIEMSTQGKNCETSIFSCCGRNVSSPSINLNCYVGTTSTVTFISPKLFMIGSELVIVKDFTAMGIKSRMVETSSYGARMLNAMESTGCYFEDFGNATLYGNGECFIYFDPIWIETVNTSMPYYVSVTKCGTGDVHVSEKHRDHFKLVGTPGLKIDWRATALQLGYENVRLDEYRELHN